MDIKKIIVITNSGENYSNFLQPLRKKYGEDIVNVIAYYDMANYKIKQAQKRNEVIDLLVIDPFAPPIYLDEECLKARKQSREEIDGYKTGVKYYQWLKSKGQLNANLVKKVAFWECPGVMESSKDVMKVISEIPIIERDDNDNHLVEAVDKILNKST